MVRKEIYSESEDEAPDYGRSGGLSREVSNPLIALLMQRMPKARTKAGRKPAELASTSAPSATSASAAPPMTLPPLEDYTGSRGLVPDIMRGRTNAGMLPPWTPQDSLSAPGGRLIQPDWDKTTSQRIGEEMMMQALMEPAVGLFQMGAQALRRSPAALMPSTLPFRTPPVPRATPMSAPLQVIKGEPLSAPPSFARPPSSVPPPAPLTAPPIPDVGPPPMAPPSPIGTNSMRAPGAARPPPLGGAPFDTLIEPSPMAPPAGIGDTLFSGPPTGMTPPIGSLPNASPFAPPPTSAGQMSSSQFHRLSPEEQLAAFLASLAGMEAAATGYLSLDQGGQSVPPMEEPRAIPSPRAIQR